MRLPSTAHTSRPWRIHELTRDFRIEDVWALPAHGSRDDFRFLVEAVFAQSDEDEGSSRVARALWAIRWKLGEMFGWDRPESGVGRRVPSLRERLPADLRDAPGPDDVDGLFTSLYLIDDELAAETANQTMHGVLHLGWVPDGTGDYHGQMTVLVRPNGQLGRAYMAAIKPFRYLIVYPSMLRQIEREWQARTERPR
jgi:Protein of unknown function (DUF2867)